MNKDNIIDEYISELEDKLLKYQKDIITEDELYDCIIETKGVFIKEAPEIEDAIWLRTATAKRDAKIIIGILKMHKKEQVKEEKFEKIFQELKIEIDGISDTIKEYTNNGNIINYLNKLKEAINLIDINTIKYCLSKIVYWYQKNIFKIQSNEFVDTDDANENFEKVKYFQEMFKDIPDEKVKVSITRNKEEPLIFLSHKSEDKKYADALEKFIIGLGVKNNQLIYTSHPLHKIPLDTNIYDYLRNHINANVFMIFLWSDKYLESPACMNEMGAAWITQNDYTNIYVPSFSFGNPKYRECAVDTAKMGAVLNGDEHCKASIIELKNKIQSIFKLENDEQKSQYLLDEFIKNIT